MAYVEITICQWSCDKERVLLDLSFSNRYEDERYGVMRKLVQIGGVRALGTTARSAKYEDERQLARNLLVQC